MKNVNAVWTVARVLPAVLCVGSLLAAEPVVDIDFAASMAGVPEGTVLRKNAEVMVYGLHALKFGDLNLPGGCQIGKRELPGAFELTATFMTPLEPLRNEKGDPIKAGGCVWDDLYSSGTHRGLQLRFDIVGERWTPRLTAGLGEQTYESIGPMREIRPGETLSLTVRYYGDRDVEWDFAGLRLAAPIAAAGRVAPGNYPVTLGDRVGSLHMPFRGYLRRVTVRPLARAPFAISSEGRTAFERGETSAALRLSVENLTAAADGLRLAATQLGTDGRPVASVVTQLVACASGAVVRVALPVETRVTPGWQKLRVTVTAADGRTATKDVKLGVGPRFADRLPVLLWQGGSAKDVAAFGFTHEMVRIGFNSRTRAEGASATESIARLDEALVQGMRFNDGSGVIPYAPGDDPAKYRRRDRAGNPIGRGNPPPAEVGSPELIARAREIAADNAAAFGDHPAYGGVLNCSEWLEHAVPSFVHEHERYKAETGRDVPDEITSSYFGRKNANARYPDGLVPDDDPVLRYLRWFWSGGSGWPAYLTAGYDEYRKVLGRYGDGSARQRRHPFFSWWDPSVRSPPRWNSCGDVDVLNQWVYSYPEAMNVGGPAEESLAMAAGRPGQQVFMMTQLINYRSQVAPKEEKVTPVPDWVTKRPNANFPTLPPDSLQEATWTMLAKPIQGIAYHGWGCIHETGEPTGYVYTNPESAQRLKHLLCDVVRPLGPVLKRLGRETSPVAVFESFTSVINGMPWASGYSAAHVTFLQRARLDPRVVYEETIERDGFAGIRVLYAPLCRFLTPSLVEKIRAFQKAGGILVADAELNPALKADVVVPVAQIRQAPKADQTADVEAAEAAFWVNRKARDFTAQQKAESVAAAEALRESLRKARFEPKADSDTPEIVTYSRRWGETDYLFAINDHRTFGEYFGQWGRTMEKGLPVSGTVSLKDPNRAIRAVYELSRGGSVKFDRDGDRVKVKLDYETNDGRFLVFLKRPIASLKVACSPSVEPGGVVKAGLRVLDSAGEVVPALLPVEIRLYDAAGKEIDGAGYLAAEDGDARVAIRTNVNDAPGPYRLVFRDRASGLTAEREVARR